MKRLRLILPNLTTQKGKEKFWLQKNSLEKLLKEQIKLDMC
jgi:hypothetical protein